VRAPTALPAVNVAPTQLPAQAAPAAPDQGGHAVYAAGAGRGEWQEGTAARLRRQYGGPLLALLLSGLVAYLLASAASSLPAQWRSAQPQHAAPVAPVSAMPHSPDAPRSPELDALLKAVEGDIHAHQNNIRDAHAMADALYKRSVALNATLVAVSERNAAAGAEAKQYLQESLRDLDALDKKASTLNVSAVAHMKEAAEHLSQEAAEGEAAAAVLFEAASTGLAANVSSAKKKVGDIVSTHAAELRLLTQRAKALEDRRGAAAATNQSRPFFNASTAGTPAELLTQLEGAQTVLAQFAEESDRFVTLELPALVEDLAAAVDRAAKENAESQHELDRASAEYAQLQQAAIEDAQKAAAEAARDAQAAVDAAVANATAGAVDNTVAATVVSAVEQLTVRDLHVDAEQSDAVISRVAQAVLSNETEHIWSETVAAFETDVAARTETILSEAEKHLQAQLNKESTLEALLHRTGYGHGNLGLEAFKDPLWEPEEDDESENENESWEEPVVAGQPLAHMHDFAVGVRGGSAVPHRTLCRASGGLRLTSPPASAASVASGGLASSLLSPFRDVLGSFGGAGKDGERGARRTDSKLRHEQGGGAARKVPQLPLTTLVSHLRPSPTAYYALQHSRGDAAATAQRSPRSREAAGFDYASSVRAALAQVTVVLHAPVNVAVLKLIHATADEDPALPDCAPRRVRLLGWTQDPATVRHLPGKVLDLGELQLQEAVPCEAYPLSSSTERGSHGYVWERVALSPALSSGLPLPPLRAVTLQVLENEGDQQEYTCLHRLQVIGAMVAESS
jgi:hypothetical protein